MNSCRWTDNDSEESDDDQPTTYLDAILRQAKPVLASPPRTQPRLVVVGGQGGTDAGW